MSQISSKLDKNQPRVARQRAAKLPLSSKYARFRRFLRFESLEERRLLAGNLTGTVYEDVDRNGIRNNGENGVAGWTVYLDQNRNGLLDSGEPTRVTNVDGDYAFGSLADGNYRINLVMQLGWIATAPESKDVVVGPSGNTRADFFIFSGGDIVGTVWNDLDQDGIRDQVPGSGEFLDVGLAGWTVFLDLNDNRLQDASEPVRVTTEDGGYSFRDLPPGDYEVWELLPEGWEVSPTFDNKQTARVISRTEYVADFANFSNTNGGIRGLIYNDLNADGLRAADPVTGEFLEPGIEGWQVYLDINHNLTFDPSEPTTNTDAAGFYSFASLLAGDYEVTEVIPSGWEVSPLHDTRQTVHVSGGEISIADDFANFTILNGSIRGKIWNDVNRNGVRDTDPLSGAILEPPLAGWQVFIDLNRNRLLDASEPSTLSDVAGDYTFLDLQVGDYEIHEIIPTGWEVSPLFNDHYTVTVLSGVESLVHDFANFNVAVATPGSIAGTVWEDMNANGIREATDAGLVGWTVYLDSNRDGTLSVGEPQSLTNGAGQYEFNSVAAGTVVIAILPMTGWKHTAPPTGSRTLTVRSGQLLIGQDFGEARRTDSAIRGVVFADTNKNGTRDAGERGLAGITTYIDANDNGLLDAGETSLVTSADLYYTPNVDEAGEYSYTHLAQGSYVVRMIVPDVLSATPATARRHEVILASGEERTGVNMGAVYRPNEIHGIKYDDLNGNHARDAGEPGMPGITIYLDTNRNNLFDAGEPSTVTIEDGSYAFFNLSPGKYVVRSIDPSDHEHTYPTTLGGTLWPNGTSNPSLGNVNPTSITQSLAQGQSHRQTVSLTLPNSGALTNLVDVFLLFDDTGSFINNSPIVRSAFPTIMTQLQASLPGIDLGFGVGRFEEYGNFGAEYATGRPFILNQPVIAASSLGYQAVIQAALDRTTPGYGGDLPETDIEALYQLVTGRGFDGNDNGSVLDSGPAGLAATQLTPGNSGDVPSFASFVADPTNNVAPAAGNIGGGGFRTGALPIILLATDTGFAYQPKGETTIVGANGVSLPLAELTQASRSTTPFSSGAGIQETVTGLNALGALVIGLGTNSAATVDPRRQLESLSSLTGAINRTTGTIANGTPDAIAPGDPLYFQIASGFGSSVANGVVSAIQNAVTAVAVDIDVIASDPRVRIINHTGIVHGVGSGATASFDIEIVGDGAPRRFDLQFVRAGTSVVLGSIPVVIGTPIPGDGYEYEDLEDGEIEVDDDFGSRRRSSAATVVERKIFYNRSSSTIFGNGTGNPLGAIDPSKAALLPGQTATIANYSNTIDGINGLLVDIAGGGVITAADLRFATWNGMALEGFVPATAVPTVSVLSGGGTAGSDRIKIEFENGSIKNTWLRVEILANSNTRLSTDDVFYFGSAVGDVYINNIGTPTIVRTNASDTAVVRQHQSILRDSVGIENWYDINKDGRVNAIDTAFVRQNQNPGSIALITAPPITTFLASVPASDATLFALPEISSPVSPASTAMGSLIEYDSSTINTIPTSSSTPTFVPCSPPLRKSVDEALLSLEALFPSIDPSIDSIARAIKSRLSPPVRYELAHENSHGGRRS